MIRSFRSKALKRFFEKNEARGLPPQFAGKIGLVLDALHTAAKIADLDAPTFGLHELKGDRAGYWAIVITRNWRITFQFVEVGTEDEAGAHEVDYEDYH